METMKKGVRVGDKTVYDTDRLYARMLVTSAHRVLDLKDVLSYELAPIPFSLFNEYGDMRKGSKSSLVSHLSVLKHSTIQPEVEIIDGNAMLYHIPWPKNATEEQLAVNFSKSVSRSHEVYVIFDRYQEGSIKDPMNVRDVHLELCPLTSK